MLEILSAEKKGFELAIEERKTLRSKEKDGSWALIESGIDERVT